MRPLLLARRGTLSSKKDVATGSELPWALPPLGAGGVAIQDVTITNSNRTSLASGGGKDLRITSGEALTGPVVIAGYRHVQWIGGAISVTTMATLNRAIGLACTGTVHLEGLNILSYGDCIGNFGGGPNTVIQIQNCRMDAHFIGEPWEHADGFQVQNNSKINQLRIGRCTIVSDYQGIFLRQSDSNCFMNSADWRQLNFRRRNAGQDPAQAWFFIGDLPDNFISPSPTVPIGPITMTDVYAEGSHSSTNSIFYPSWIFESALRNPPLGPYGNRRGIFKATDGIGQYVRPSTTSDTVPAGGSASGQSCLSPGWSGIVRLGVPPSGDYCPAGTPGISYVSPGYV